MAYERTRSLNRLTALKVARAKAPGMYADGGSLYLRVADGGSKQWIFRYVANGRLRDMGLGPVHTLSLAEARERATEARKLRLDGIDPIAHKRARRAALAAADAKAMTFRQCAEGFIKDNEAKWTNAKHRREWEGTLSQYVYPALGSLPVAAIDTPLVLKVIKPLWERVPETASRVRGRIENVLGWATVHHYRTGDNPARWQGHLEHALPARSDIPDAKVEHHAALPYEQVAAFMAKLRQNNSVGARCTEFITLTAARVSEAAPATWPEIDFVARVWTVPADRIKGRLEHRVPLSAAAIAVLKQHAAIRQSDYVFPGARNGRPVSENTPNRLAKLAAGADITAHGLRSTFRDWAAERTNFPRELAEKALAHIVGDETERAYQRGDLLEKRRKLMEAWAEFCGKPAASGRVVDDLAKAKILLAWAVRVYGPDEEADEYEYNRFLEVGCKIAGIESETLRRVSQGELLATMSAADREAALTAASKRGRPPKPHKHLLITHTIEAYIGAGLTRTDAIDRAAENWHLARSSIDKIYRDNKLPKPISEGIRGFLDPRGRTGAAEDVDEHIRRCRERERRGE